MRSRSKYLILTTEYLIPLFFLLLALLAYLALSYSSFFTLTKISCELDYQPCNNPVLTAELDRSLGESLFRFDQDQLKKRLLSGEFTLREVSLHKSYPHTLEIELLSTYPVVALQLSEVSQQWFALDSRFRLIAIRDSDPNVPTLVVDNLPPLQLSQSLEDDSLTSALNSVMQIAKEIPSATSYHLADNVFTLEFDNNLTAYLSLDKDLPSQLTTLQSLLADEAVITSYTIIDLRYYQPVLK